MKRGWLALGLALAVFAAPLQAQDEKAGALGIGDAAPKLAFDSFVKGKPVEAIEKDRIYVLEFWATWCGPCIAAIPHVTQLQKQNPNVVFIGVNVWERDLEKVKPFVEKMGDKMDYRVALDKGGEGGKGEMAQNWLAAAGQNGIPCSMIVNGAGKIAWIGHPMKMDKPLAQIVGGKWDLEVAKAEAKKEKEVQAKMRKLSRDIQAAVQKGPGEALKVVDAAIEADAEIEKQLGMFKFSLLEKLQKPDLQIEYGNKLIDKIIGDNPQGLNQFAWPIIDPARKEEAPEGLKKLALKAALKADVASELKDGMIADTLARAYFVTGDKAKALATQERAVKLAKGTQFEDEINARLEEYKKNK